MSNDNTLMAKADGDEPDIFDKRDDMSDKFTKVTWFERNNLKVLDVNDGWDFAVFLCENAEGKKEFYSIGQQIREAYNANAWVSPNRFGTNAKAVYGSCVYQIVDVDANQVADYACTHDSVFYLLKGDDGKKKSIVPEKPEATGLIHFWKQEDGKWSFATHEEYEEKKAEMPSLVFASRSTIADFSDKVFPDISTIPTGGMKNDGTPVYYAQHTVAGGEDEEVTRIEATEEQALQGSQKYDLNPIIFIRAKGALENSQSILPTLKLTDYFTQTEENEQVSYCIKKSVILDSDLENVEIRDADSKAFLKSLQSFTPDMDAKLMAQVDEYAKRQSKSSLTIKASSIDTDSFTWSKESAMAKTGEKLLKMRAKLLLKLVKAWVSLEKIASLDDKEVEGTLAHLLFSNKHLIPPTVLSTIVDSAVESVGYEYCEPGVSVNRRKAMNFAESGKVDHEGKYSIFG